jgi:hypothetical protein
MLKSVKIVWAYIEYIFPIYAAIIYSTCAEKQLDLEAKFVNLTRTVDMDGLTKECLL